MPLMSKWHEVRREALIRLVKGMGRGGTARVAEAIDAQWSYVSRLMYEPGRKHAKNIGEDIAEKITLAFPDWLDEAHQYTDEITANPETAMEPEPAYSRGSLAHPTDYDAATIPQTMNWEEIMACEPLPSRFVLAMPDDALAPNTPRGIRLILERHAPGTTLPAPGTGILVEDQTGRRHLRMFAQGHGDDWEAHARVSAYRSLKRSEDGLDLLAVVTGRLDGAV